MGNAIDIDSVVATLRSIGTDTQHIEVKACASGISKNLPESVSAFANGQGGLVLLGLEEAEGFRPTPGFSAKKVSEGLAQVLADRVDPPIRTEILILPFEDAHVVAAQVDPIAPVERPCYVKSRGIYNGSFIRGGDGDRKLTAYEVERLLENRKQPRFDEEIVVDARLDDLDSHAVNALMRRLQVSKPRLFSVGQDRALQRLRLIRSDEDGVLRPTISGLLTLGAFPQEFFPRLNVAFAVYPGVSKGDIFRGNERLLDSRTIDGTIPQMVKDTIDAVSVNMRTGGIIEGAFRKDLPDYPLEAVREAVTNALMHRDYSPISRGTPVQVDMFPDRLEVVNPGGLFGTVTVAGLGRDGISSSRNAQLSRVLEDVALENGGLVAENRGTGYATIVTKLRDALMPAPVPEDTPSAFRLTLYRRALTEAETSTSPKPNTETAILSALADHRSLSSSQIMEFSRLSRTTVMRYLNALLERGEIEATDSRFSPRRRYRIVKNR
ncbi:MAG: ATP-binding protein [Actinomycetaceae bacterium]|nr:ATP-binding protein [Actinomycetaceae bacterium]